MKENLISTVLGLVVWQFLLGLVLLTISVQHSPADPTPIAVYPPNLHKHTETVINNYANQVVQEMIWRSKVK